MKRKFSEISKNVAVSNRSDRQIDRENQVDPRIIDECLVRKQAASELVLLTSTDLMKKRRKTGGNRINMPD